LNRWEEELADVLKTRPPSRQKEMIDSVSVDIDKSSTQWAFTILAAKANAWCSAQLEKRMESGE
jgi:hypothetical protein